MTDEEAGGAERWLRPFFAESTLWPVTVAAAGIGATLLAALLLLAIGQRNLFAALALLGVFWISVDATWRDRQGGRIGLVGRCLMGLWLLGIAAAGGAVWSGLF